jgi:GT2 family glycosyltransferase
MNFSIVIPNWNGEKLLRRNLPAILATGANEVIVSDDDSTDGSTSFLENNYPQVRIVKHRRLGFAGNCNEGVRAAKGDIIVLLNTDVIPRKDFLKYLESDFLDRKVFAVSLNEVNDSGFSWTKGKFERGFIMHQAQKKDDRTHQTFWVSGGSGAFRKKMWQKLGGMDDLFSPFYWEDVDLCYRAQKRGWKLLWRPKSAVQHEHEGVINQNFPKKYIDSVWERNQLIFIWKNLTDWKMFLSHLAGIFYRLRRPGYIKVVFAAALKLPWILPKRSREWKEKEVSDREIFAKFQ